MKTGAPGRRAGALALVLACAAFPAAQAAERREAEPGPLRDTLTQG